MVIDYKWYYITSYAAYSLRKPPYYTADITHQTSNPQTNTWTISFASFTSFDSHPTKQHNSYEIDYMPRYRHGHQFSNRKITYFAISMHVSIAPTTTTVTEKLIFASLKFSSQRRLSNNARKIHPWYHLKFDLFDVWCVSTNNRTAEEKIMIEREDSLPWAEFEPEIWWTQECRVPSAEYEHKVIISIAIRNKIGLRS